MTFLRYSRLTSSSLEGDAGMAGCGELTRDGTPDKAGEPGRWFSATLSDRAELQYPTPGFLWRSNNAADDCTLRSSSLRV